MSNEQDWHSHYMAEREKVKQLEGFRAVDGRCAVAQEEEIAKLRKQLAAEQEKYRQEAVALEQMAGRYNRAIIDHKQQLAAVVEALKEVKSHLCTYIRLGTNQPELDAVRFKIDAALAKIGEAK